MLPPIRLNCTPRSKFNFNKGGGPFNSLVPEMFFSPPPLIGDEVLYSLQREYLSHLSSRKMNPFLKKASGKEYPVSIAEMLSHTPPLPVPFVANGRGPVPISHRPSRMLFISKIEKPNNVPLSEFEIIHIFSRFGTVECCYVSVNKTGTEFFAIVQMGSEDEASQAIRFVDSTMQMGCRIRVAYSNKMPVPIISNHAPVHSVPVDMKSVPMRPILGYNNTE